jgi:hypothetical protein
LANPTKNAGNIRVRGGGVLKILLVTSTGPAGTEVAADWIDLGYIETNGVTDQMDEEEYQDETGDVVQTDFSNRVVKLSGNLMQSDLDLITYLKETVRDNYFSIYWLSDKNINNKRQELVFPICKISPGFELVSGTKRPPFNATVLKNASAINYDAAGTGGSNAELPTNSYATGVAAISVAAGEFWDGKETAI